MRDVHEIKALVSRAADPNEQVTIESVKVDRTASVEGINKQTAENFEGFLSISQFSFHNNGSISPGNFDILNPPENIKSAYFNWRWFTRGTDKFKCITIEYTNLIPHCTGPCMITPSNLLNYDEAFYSDLNVGIDCTSFANENSIRDGTTFQAVAIANQNRKGSYALNSLGILPRNLKLIPGERVEYRWLFNWRFFKVDGIQVRLLTIE